MKQNNRGMGPLNLKQNIDGVREGGRTETTISLASSSYQVTHLRSFSRDDIDVPLIIVVQRLAPLLHHRWLNMAEAIHRNGEKLAVETRQEIHAIRWSRWQYRRMKSHL